jgi:hypothetical protein
MLVVFVLALILGGLGYWWHTTIRGPAPAETPTPEAHAEKAPPAK